MSSIKKTDHFYLVDGSGYIFRAYYALPPLSRKSDGPPTGAVSGFCSMLFKLLEDSRSDDSKNKPSHKSTFSTKLTRQKVQDQQAEESSLKMFLQPQFHA